LAFFIPSKSSEATETGIGKNLKLGSIECRRFDRNDDGWFLLPNGCQPSWWDLQREKKKNQKNQLKSTTPSKTDNSSSKVQIEFFSSVAT
jgi:hypothetical protein